ncbi:MAG: hypothetical protein RLZZ522_179 [Verrucomicrobiota bacterium]
MKFPVLALMLCLPLAAEPLPSLTAMKSAAEAFLGSLDAAQRKRAACSFAAAERENFRFTPQVRSGLPLKEMNPAQRAAAMKLLDAALSDQGKLKATQIMTLEGVLAELEQQPDFRDAGKYDVSIFGTPGDPTGWGWKFEGHHLALTTASTRRTGTANEPRRKLLKLLVSKLTSEVSACHCRQGGHLRRHV